MLKVAVNRLESEGSPNPEKLKDLPRGYLKMCVRFLAGLSSQAGETG